MATTTTVTTEVTRPSWIQTFALKVLGLAENFWFAVAPSLSKAFQSGVAAALPIVEPIVIGLASDPTKSGVQKAAAALSAAKPQLIAAGITIETNVINSAITLAVSKLSASTAVSGQPTSTTITPAQ